MMKDCALFVKLINLFFFPFSYEILLVYAFVIWLQNHDFGTVQYRLIGDGGASNYFSIDNSGNVRLKNILQGSQLTEFSVSRQNWSIYIFI